MDKIKDYFARYPNSDEVYVSGGLLFHNRGDADSYSNDTKRYVRGESATDTKAIDTTPPQIAGVDLSTLSYDELKALAAKLDIKPATNKKDDYLSALIDYQNLQKQPE